MQAKWPEGIDDTIGRYLPSVAGTLYVKTDSEIPGRPGAIGSTNSRIVWYKTGPSHSPYIEHRIFLHEIMHVYEYRLRLACWDENRDIDGWVLAENWLRAYDEDRLHLESLGLLLEERDAYELDENSRARETLARFAAKYFMPEDRTLQFRLENPTLPYQTYRELAEYAPNRYAYFEKIVFERYLGEKRWLRAGADAEDWPGMCTAPLNEGVTALEYLLKSAPGSNWPATSTAPPKCAFLDLP